MRRDRSPKHSRRKLSVIAICLAGLGACGCCAQRVVHTDHSAPLTIADLTTRPVLGRLGLPLGRISEMQATIVSGDALREKRYAGQYLLRVTEVDGHRLAEPPTLEFRTRGLVDLAPTPFDLYEMKTGKKAASLDSDKISALEKGYVGKNVRLDAYETGEFSGIPAGNLPPGMPIWQDHAWEFSTYLIVLAERR